MRDWSMFGQTNKCIQCMHRNAKTAATHYTDQGSGTGLAMSNFLLPHLATHRLFYKGIMNVLLTYSDMILPECACLRNDIKSSSKFAIFN